MKSRLFLLSWAAFLWQKAGRNTDNVAASLLPVFRSWPVLKLLPAWLSGSRQSSGFFTWKIWLRLRRKPSCPVLGTSRVAFLMQMLLNSPHNILNRNFWPPFFFCILLAYFCWRRAAPFHSLVWMCLQDPAVLPLQLTRRLFVQEEVYFKAGLWSVWEDPPKECSSGVLPAGLSCRAGCSSLHKGTLAELDLQLCCALCDLCERVPIGMVVILR